MVDFYYSQIGREKTTRFRYLLNRVRDWRNAMIRDVRFQNWALKFWLTRSLVRNRQKQLFDLTAGFVYSQILFCCVRLQVFQSLERGALTLDELAFRLAIDRSAVQVLVEAAASLDLLIVNDNTVRLDDLGAALLANPGVCAMIEHHEMLYRDLADPLALLCGTQDQTELSAFWGYATSNTPRDLGSERIDEYSRLMAATQTMIAREVLGAYSFSRHKKLLDVGGGEGAFVRAVGAAYPHLILSSFDLPAVSARATQQISKFGMDGRFSAYEGSFFHDDLPQGADVISLIRVLYDHNDEKVLNILARVRKALPPKGTLVISEPMAKIGGAEAMGSAYFGFYLLAMRSGRPRCAHEIKALLQQVGFKRIKSLKTRSPLLTSVIIAQR